MPVEANDFKAALGRFPSGVTVVTLNHEGQDHGMTASAFSSLSLDPPLVLVCVKKVNATHGLLEAAGSFGISFLSQDQVERSNRFAGMFPKDQDKFADLAFTRGEHSGAALLHGAMAGLDCSLHSVLDGGDHSIFVGQVEGTRVEGDKDDLAPLLYFAGGYRGAGEKLPSGW